MANNNGGNNPIGYSDLFNFDDPIIKEAIQEIKGLLDTWKEFKKEVSNPVKLAIDSQSKDLKDTILGVAKAAESLNVTQEKSQQVLINNLAAIEDLKNKYEELKKTKKGAGDTEKMLEDSVNGLNQKLKEQLTIYRNMSKEKDPMALKTLAAEIQVTRYEITELNNATKGTTSAFQAAKGSYNALDAETKRLVADLKMLDNGLSSNNQVAKQMQAQILANTTQLKAFDAGMGQNFRNVGNYSSALTGYANTLRGLRGPTKLFGEAIGIGAQEADQFRIVLEHSLQGLAALSRGAANGKKDLDALAAATQGLTATTEEINAAMKARIQAENLNALAVEKTIAANEAALLSTEARIAADREFALSTEELTATQAQRVVAGKAIVAAEEAEIAATQANIIAKEAKAAADKATAEAAALNTAGVQANTIAQEENAAATTLASRAMNFLKVASFTLGFAAVAAGIAFLIYKIIHFREEAKKAAEMQNILNDVMKEADKEAGKQITSLDALYHSAMDANIPLAKRLGYIKELQNEFPEYFKGQTKEQVLNGLSEKSYRNLADAILASAKARAAKAKIDDIAAKQLDLEYETQKVNEDTNKKKSSVKGDRVTTITGGTGSVGGTEIRITADQQKAEVDRAAKVQLDLLGINKKKLQDQADFLVKFAGGQQKIADTIVGDKTKDTTEKDAKKSKAAADKAEREAEQAERKLEAAIKKQEQMIEASAKLQVAQAELAYAQSSQTSEKQIELELNKAKILNDSFNSRLKLYGKDNIEYTKILDEQAKAEKETQVKILSIRIKAADEKTKILLSQAEVEYNHTSKGWTDELEFEQKRIKIVEDGFDARLALYAKDSDDYKATLQAKLEAEATSEAKVTALRLNQNKARQAAIDAGTDTTNELFKNNIKSNVQSGKIDKKEGDLETHNFNSAVLNDAIREKELQLSKAKDGDADYFNFQKELANLQKQLIDENANYEISAAENVKQKKVELQQAVTDFTKETATEVFSFGSDINKQAIEDLNKRKQEEIQVAGTNGAAIKQIQDNYDRQILAKKRKQAVYDKLEALFNIGINTAIAVSKSVAASPTTFGMPFTAFAIAQGAIQSALVLAKPLPKYYKGRSGGESEYAEVNEFGAELLENKGRLRIAAGGKKAVTLLEKGEIVHTAESTKRIFNKFKEQEDSDNFMQSLLEGTSVVTANQNNKDRSIINAILSSKLSDEAIYSMVGEIVSRMPHDTLEANEAGLRRYTRTRNSKIEHLNSRNSMTGNG